MDHDHSSEHKCLICEEGVDALSAKLKRDVELYGRSVIVVFDVDEPFGYSIGNSLRSMPELFVRAKIHPESICKIINWFSELQLERSRPLADQEYVDLGGGAAPLYVAELDDYARDEFTVQATHALGREYQLRQLVLSDASHRFPWNAGCVEPYASQRVVRRLS